MYIDTPLMRLADLPADVDGWQYERRPSAPASNPFDHTFLKHAPHFGTHGWISDDTWIPALPEPGAQLHEIKTIWSYWENFDPWDRGRRQYDARLIILHLAGGLPDPDAPITVDLNTQANRHPLFARTDDSDLTVGECTRCTDPNHHALIEGLCNACRQEVKALHEAHR